MKTEGEKESVPISPCYVQVLYGKYKTTDEDYKNMYGMGTNKVKLEYIPPEYEFEEFKKETASLYNRKISDLSKKESDYWLGKLVRADFESTGRGEDALYLHGVKFCFRGERLPSDEWESEGDLERRVCDHDDVCLDKDGNKSICFDKLLERGQKLKDANQLEEVKKWTEEEISMLDQSTSTPSSGVGKGIIIGSSVSGSIVGTALLALASIFLRKRFF